MNDNWIQSIFFAFIFFFFLWRGKMGVVGVWVGGRGEGGSQKEQN